MICKHPPPHSALSLRQLDKQKFFTSMLSSPPLFPLAPCASVVTPRVTSPNLMWPVAQRPHGSCGLRPRDRTRVPWPGCVCAAGRGSGAFPLRAARASSVPSTACGGPSCPPGDRRAPWKSLAWAFCSTRPHVLHSLKNIFWLHIPTPAFRVWRVGVNIVRKVVSQSVPTGSP